MKKILRHALLAAGLSLSLQAAAQNEQMIIHGTDGSLHRFAVANVDSVTFGAKAEAANPLKLAVDETGQLYAAFSTAPGEAVGTYNVMWLSAAEFARYKSDDDAVADDLKFFTELAQGYGMELPKLLEEFLYTGPTGDYITGVQPGTEYVVWGYGMDTGGKLTTPFYKTTFRTAPVERKEGAIAISATKGTDGKISVTFTPDDDSRPYVSGFMAGLVNEKSAQEKMNANTSSALYDYLAGGEGVEAALGALSSKGVTTVPVDGLSDGNAYYAVAAYISDGGAVESAVSKVELNEAAAATPAEAAVFTPSLKAAKRAPAQRGIRAAALRTVKP